jgi:transposase
MALSHKPAQAMYLNFAGKTMQWVDQDSGQVHDYQVLVAVLPHSHYTFAIALASQKVLDFVHGINESLRYFGDVPQSILSDNLKSYVSRANRYEPDFNELCVQLSAHYQVDLQATRVAKPRNKASAENSEGEKEEPFGNLQLRQGMPCLYSWFGENEIFLMGTCFIPQKVFIFATP